MSDTNTTTITAEERATLRSLATKGQSSPKNMLRALDAIAQADAHANFANNVLQAASDCIVSGDPTSDVGLFLACDEFDKKLLVDIAALRTRAEKAEARAEEYNGFIAALVAGLRQRWPRATAAMTCEDCTAGDVFSSVLDPIVLALTERAEKADAELKKDLAHCKFEFDRAEKAESDLARVKAAGIEAMRRAEKAEAENARLTKMVDWLADKLATLHPDCPLKHLKQRPLGWKCHEGSQGPCSKSQAAGCWAEAASRDVADSEVIK